MAPLYSFLQTNQIRLLSVSRGETSLVGTLKTISISDTKSRYDSSEKKLDFFAVSYVWGSRDDDKIIVVDGHEVTITRNAHNVLSLFCDWPQQRNRRAWVWIDVVCINQQDVLEKSIQVPLMAAIYGRAKRAVVWLGESTASSDEGMDLMRTLAVGKAGYPVPQSAVKNSNAWAGVEEIASRPWWRRAWTLQESVLPSDTVYYCGSKCLTADEVRSAVLVFSSYQYTNTEVHLIKATFAPLWHRRRIYQWLGHQDLDDDFDGYERRRRSGHRKLGQISLPALLAYQRHSLSTNPKDYLYSLLGCIKDKDKQLVGPPAYDSSTEEVYRNFVRSWVLAYQSLDIIAFAELFRGNKTATSSVGILPSWVPDWSARVEMASEESNAVPLLISQPNKSHIGSMLPPRFLRRNPEVDYYGGELPIYAAAENMAMRAAFSKNLMQLTCTGVILDTIDGLTVVDTEHATSVVQSTSTKNVDFNGAPPEPGLVGFFIIGALYLDRADVYLQYEITDDSNFRTEAGAALTDQDNAETADYRAWVKTNADLKIRGVTLLEALTVSAAEREHDEEANVQRRRSVSPRRPSTRRPSMPWYPVPALTLRHRRESVDSNDSNSSAKIQEDEESTKHSFVRKFRTATHANWMAKRLAVTSHGHVAMAPRATRKDDMVCALFGCSVPMVLRSVGDGKYEVVGECYMHGFMKGRGLRKEPQNFTLV